MSWPHANLDYEAEGTFAAAVLAAGHLLDDPRDDREEHTLVCLGGALAMSVLAGRIRQWDGETLDELLTEPTPMRIEAPVKLRAAHRRGHRLMWRACAGAVRWFGPDWDLDDQEVAADALKGVAVATFRAAKLLAAGARVVIAPEDLDDDGEAGP